MNRACSFNGCHKNEKGNLELCTGHYQQKTAGKELKPLKAYRRYAQPTPDTKICTKCLTVKALADFYTRPNGKPTSRCRECAKAEVAMYKARALVEAR